MARIRLGLAVLLGSIALTLSATVAGE